MTKFTTVSYTPSGQQVDKGHWEMSLLSRKWLDICTEILSSEGNIFHHTMDGALSHFEIRFTGGIAHFYSHKLPAFSALYLKGADGQYDQKLLDLFCEFLRQFEIIRNLCPDLPAFVKSIKSHGERPLCITVIWGSTQIDQRNYDAMMELGNHFAGAYLCR